MTFLPIFFAYLFVSVNASEMESGLLIFPFRDDRTLSNPSISSYLPFPIVFPVDLGYFLESPQFRLKRLCISILSPLFSFTCLPLRFFFHRLVSVPSCFLCFLGHFHSNLSDLLTGIFVYFYRPSSSIRAEFTVSAFLLYVVDIILISRFMKILRCLFFHLAIIAAYEDH